VPAGFYVTTAAYQHFVAANKLQPGILAALPPADNTQLAELESAASIIRALFEQASIPPDLEDAIVQAYTSLAPQNDAIAVRSSATAEDLPNLSFAGQQETYLNIQGAEAVLTAVKRCWASLWTARAISYRVQHKVDQHAVSLAVAVQMLVSAESAGILFTVNPITGNRGEMVINVAWGLGEAVVGGLVTPDTLIVDRSTGRVLQREIADKQVMTARTIDGTIERSVPDELRQAPALDDDAAAELMRLGTQIENLFNMPVDIEWARADGRFHILQARPITALPEALAPIPTEWNLPDPKGMYLRNNIVELMPDPLTPLFGTLGRAAINAGMQRAMTAIGGQNILPPEVIVTINDYAYYNGTFTPGQIGRILLSSVGFVSYMFRDAEQRWRDEAYPHYVAVLERWQSKRWREFPAVVILSGVREIMDAVIDHYMALLAGVIPIAWVSEGLLTGVYDRLLKQSDDPPARTFLLGYASTPIRAEQEIYDLAQRCRTRAGLSAYLARTPAPQLAAEFAGNQPPQGVDTDDWRIWQNRFHSYLQQYGHAVYDLDFARPIPLDDPAPLLETLKLFMSGQGSNPHTRQEAAAQRREEATAAMLQRLTGLRLRLFRTLVTWAQTYAPLREDGLAAIGLGYPLLRQMLRELGQRLIQTGAIEQADDVFWLIEAELKQAAIALDRDKPLSSFAAPVQQRKAVWRAAKQVTPPILLPQHSAFMGIELSRFGPAGTSTADENTFEGVGASPGLVTAPACVIAGPEEFDQMQSGAVLVARITTPAWTPLFARAAAIVTDVGGPLSHGSIVAREYGIPAVLGTGTATQHIRSGQMITVDGDAGRVSIAV
jgi:pyruvate,water dikinase